MSGMKNLANAVANDPGFAKQTAGMMSAKEATQYINCGKTGGSNGGKPKRGK